MLFGIKEGTGGGSLFTHGGWSPMSHAAAICALVLSLMLYVSPRNTTPYSQVCVTRSESTKHLAEMWRTNSVNGCTIGDSF